MDATAVVERTAAPTGRPTVELDVRSLPPPRPLRETLERLEALADDVVLVQRNDRAPQHLYPLLDDRGYAHDTGEAHGEVVTAIWRPS